ncbi:glycosyltransferase family 2 protein [Zunongwangia sp. H14]|uniref:glycosyltransferase family 2 protein n=1 Tax=Zunongwangia sp. H14 TaxID=3240792 RepID=UPI0035624C1B
MDKNLPWVYVIILNYNSSHDSVSLFKNLKRDLYQNFQILIIDNCSKSEDVSNLQQNIPHENLIFSSRNLGYAGGNNIGIKKALEEKADYVWILNPDIRTKRNTLSLLLNLMERDHSLAAVGPRIISREHSDKIFSDGEVIDKLDGIKTFHKNHNKFAFNKNEKVDYEIDYIDGSSILLRTAAIYEIGFLPEEYFMYWEETDWCTNAKLYEWKLAVNRSAIVYNLNSPKNGSFHYFYIRNKLLYSKKYKVNYIITRNKEIRVIKNEILKRFKGIYFKPFFFYRLKGLLSGLLINSFK